MSPIQVTPNRGYADWQRISNFDSGILYSVTTPGNNAAGTSPTLDVSRYAFLGGQMGSILNVSQCNFQWFSDAATSITVGQQAMVFHPNVLNSARLRLVNMGPFLKTTLQPAGGGNYQMAASLFGTNRDSPLPLLPQFGLVLSSVSVGIGAGANVNVYPTDYYAGPVTVDCLSAGGGVQFTANAWLPTGVSTFISETLTPAAGVVGKLTFTAPAYAWFITVNNPGAANTYWLSCAPTLTGSS